MKEFEEKVALVSGRGSGIGRANSDLRIHRPLTRRVQKF